MKIAALLVALVLVLAAISASAECPWVLWVEAPVGSDQWSIASVPQLGSWLARTVSDSLMTSTPLSGPWARCTGREARPATNSAVSRAQSIRDRKEHCSTRARRRAGRRGSDPMIAASHARERTDRE
jgi:hypothetical protein